MVSGTGGPLSLLKVVSRRCHGVGFSIGFWRFYRGYIAVGFEWGDIRVPGCVGFGRGVLLGWVTGCIEVDLCSNGLVPWGGERGNLVG